MYAGMQRALTLRNLSSPASAGSKSYRAVAALAAAAGALAGAGAGAAARDGPGAGAAAGACTAHEEWTVAQAPWSTRTAERPAGPAGWPSRPMGVRRKISSVRLFSHRDLESARGERPWITIPDRRGLVVVNQLVEAVELGHPQKVLARVVP